MKKLLLLLIIPLLISCGDSREEIQVDIHGLHGEALLDSARVYLSKCSSGMPVSSQLRNAYANTAQAYIMLYEAEK